MKKPFVQEKLAPKVQCPKGMTPAQKKIWQTGIKAKRLQDKWNAEEAYYDKVDQQAVQYLRQLLKVKQVETGVQQKEYFIDIRDREKFRQIDERCLEVPDFDKAESDCNEYDFQLLVDGKFVKCHVVVQLIGSRIR